MARLFVPANANSFDEEGKPVVGFWYRHPGRSEALVDVHLDTMMVRYTSRVGNTAGYAGLVEERNPFGNFLLGQSRHHITMQDIHSRWGIPQLIVFMQVGPARWTGWHRNHDLVQLLLRPKVNSSIVERPLRFLRPTDVIPAPDCARTGELEGGWVVEEVE